MARIHQLKLWIQNYQSSRRQARWQRTLRQRASQCQQVNQNLAVTVGSLLSSKKRAVVKSSRLLTVATWVRSNVAALLGRWLPQPMQTRCWQFRLTLKTRCSSLRRKLKHRLIARLLRVLIPACYVLLLTRYLTPWIRSRKSTSATKPSKPVATRKPSSNTNQPWLSNLKTGSSWLRMASRWF